MVEKLKTRMRRLRENAFMRELCSEHRLHTRDLIYPIFVHKDKSPIAVPTMPGIYRHSIDSMLAEIEHCRRFGIEMVALFPYVDRELKCARGLESANPDGLIPQCIRKINERFPSMGVMADVALDPYTDHGHDGVLDEYGAVDNTRTVQALCRQSLTLARAGCRVLAPSDMMDGRVGAIRDVLEENNYGSVVIVSYSAKYASHLYGPFRDAVGAASRLGSQAKRGYQLDPSCARQAMREGELDVREGADVLLIKPALPYLDIIYRFRQRFDLPIFAYQVSGEYAMLKWTAHHDCGHELDMAHESLLSIKRAGADAIVSYFALKLVQEKIIR